MTAVSVTRGSRAGAKTATDSPKMIIRDSSGFRLVVPYAPREVEFDQNGIDWQESPRPGRMPALRYGAKKPRRVTMTFTFYNKNRASVGRQVNVLLVMSNRDRHLSISYTSMEKGSWLITNITYRVLKRNIYNHPYHVEVTCTFQEVRRDQVVPGPVMAKRNPPKPRKKKSGGRIYTVRRGDTLWDLAERFYGSGLKWRRIADANGVKNPRLLQIGKRLRIP